MCVEYMGLLSYFFFNLLGPSVNALVLHFQLPGDKIRGLAKFLLGIGVPGDAKDFFNQVESLAFLESNR